MLCISFPSWDEKGVCTKDALKRLGLPKRKGEGAQAGADHLLLVEPPTCTFGKTKELGDQVPVCEKRLMLAVHLLGTVRPLGQAAPQVSFRDCPTDGMTAPKLL